MSVRAAIAAYHAPGTGPCWNGVATTARMAGSSLAQLDPIRTA